jgi:predicted NUDIX family phosphoesterase
MDARKANELVLGFDEKFMYGFTGLLSVNYPEELLVRGTSKEETDIKWFKECCRRSYFLPRGIVEENPAFKQIIPYLVVRCKNRIFTYRRAGSEGRLVGNLSIGIGGHINISDIPVNADLTYAPRTCAEREIYEELDFKELTYSDRMRISLAFANNPMVLYDPFDPVGMVHFGAVYIINVSEIVAAGLSMKEEGKLEDWLDVNELNSPEVWDSLEGWSKLVVGSGCL